MTKPAAWSAFSKAKMPVATQNKFQDFAEQTSKGKHIFGTHVYKVALTNTAPVATNTILANITQITAANGYVSGGNATTITNTETAGVSTVAGTQVVYTASGGSIGPFRYAVLYNDTQTVPVKPLVSWVDYGSAVTLAAGDTLTIRFNATTPGTIHTLT